MVAGRMSAPAGTRPSVRLPPRWHFGLWVLQLALAAVLPALTAAQPDAEQGAPDAARRALAAQRPEEALALARAHLQDEPADADAHVVAGLALFRMDQPRQALEHFEQAIALGADDDRRVVAFNRGSCLFAIGRAPEAERVFLDSAASSDPQIATLSLVNAGYAALEQGAHTRAAIHHAQAGDRDQTDVLSDVRAELADAIDLATPDAAAERRDSEGVRFARRPPDSPLSLVAEAGGGYDDNPSQAGYGEQSAITPRVESPFLSIVADLALPLQLSSDWTVAPSYTLSQVVYTAADASDWSSQDHVVEVDLQHALNGDLRVGVAPFFSLGFSGLESFRPRSMNTGLVATIRFESDRHWATEASVQVDYSGALRSEFDFLTGVSFGGGIAQTFQHGRLDLLGRLSMSHEGLGQQQLDGLIGDETYVVPLAYTAPTGLLWARLGLFGPLSVIAWVQLELRLYDRAFTRATPFTTAVPVIRQQDARVHGTLALAYQLAEHFTLQAGYQVHASSSNVGEAHRHYGDENFERHVGWLRASLSY